MATIKKNTKDPGEALLRKAERLLEAMRKERSRFSKKTDSAIRVMERSAEKAETLSHSLDRELKKQAKTFDEAIDEAVLSFLSGTSKNNRPSA